MYGGRAVLKGTRFPVTLIGTLVRDGWSPQRIHEEYLADVDISLVYAGIAHYMANRAQVDAEIEDDAREYDRLAAAHRAESGETRSS